MAPQSLQRELDRLTRQLERHDSTLESLIRGPAASAAHRVSSIERELDGVIRGSSHQERALDKLRATIAVAEEEQARMAGVVLESKRTSASFREGLEELRNAARDCVSGRALEDAVRPLRKFKALAGPELEDLKSIVQKAAQRAEHASEAASKAEETARTANVVARGVEMELEQQQEVRGQAQRQHHQQGQHRPGQGQSVQHGLGDTSDIVQEGAMVEYSAPTGIDAVIHSQIAEAEERLIRELSGKMNDRLEMVRPCLCERR